MAVSRLGLPRAAPAAEQLRTRGVDHAARQSEFSWVRRFPAHGVGPCRPGARRSVPRLLFSRRRARTRLFRRRLYDLSFSWGTSDRLTLKRAVDSSSLMTDRRTYSFTRRLHD